MTVRLPFTKLSAWQQVAFSAALLERMLPNYLMFADATGVDNANLMRNQLDLIWQWLDKSQKVKINFDAQLTKLEEQVPDPQQFDFFGVYPALDTTMAVMALLQSMQAKDAEGVSAVSKLSFNSVAFYVELMLDQDSDDPEQEIDEKVIFAHPLVEWEKAMQSELFDFIKQAPENKNTLAQAKIIAIEQGLSNLGIEIN